MLFCCEKSSYYAYAIVFHGDSCVIAKSVPCRNKAWIDPRQRIRGSTLSALRDLAKSSNTRPQGQGVTIWFGLRTRVRFRVTPPIKLITYTISC